MLYDESSVYFFPSIYVLTPTVVVLAQRRDKISITSTETLSESSNLNLIYSLMPAAAENNAFGDDLSES